MFYCRLSSNEAHNVAQFVKIYLLSPKCGLLFELHSRSQRMVPVARFGRPSARG